MSLDLILNSFDAIVILGVSIPAILVARRINVPRLRLLGTLLALFLVIHGIYHLTAVLSAYYGGDTLDFLSDGFTEPISYLILLAFGVSLYRLGE
jgi:hypothetical protein